MKEHRRLERETDDEILGHLEHRIADLVARGMTRRQAEEEALRRFGPLDIGRAEMLAAARHRDQVLTMIDRFDALRHDAAYAFRQIRRAPALAATVIATFALGVGANAMMFGLLDRLLLRGPAHVSAPATLVRVQWKSRFGKEIVDNSSLSYPHYTAVRDNSTAFESVAMQTYPNPVSFGLGRGAHPVQHILVSGNYFQTLGTAMAIGRPILPEDDILPVGSPVVVIGYGLWQSEFAGDRDVVGKTVNIAGHTYTVIGVAPKDFVGTGTRVIDIWIPVSAAEGLRFAGKEWATEAGSSWMTGIARLKPGITPTVAGEQVAAAVRAVNSTARAKPDTDTFALPLRSVLPKRQAKLSADTRVALLLGAVSVLVLLIACANVANLLLARALRRRREIAVRLALGISRGRLVRQLVIEGMALAALGGIASLFIAHFGGSFMYRVLLSDSARPSSFVDSRVLLFTLAATLGVGIATAFIPAVQASLPDLTRDLKEGSRGAGSSHSRTRTSLLLVQAALSVVLLAGTGAFLLSLRRINSVSLGVDLDRLAVGSIDLRSVGMDSVRSRQYFNDALEAVRRIPGVESVAISEAGPFTDWSMGIGYRIPGRDTVPEFDQGPYRHGVSPEYFRTVGTRIVRGRAFNPSDFSPAAERVIIMNESAARRLWPTQDAIGQCILGGKKDTLSTCARIVGIAEDTHRNSVVEQGTRMQVYNPIGNSNRTEPRAFRVIVRSTGDPATIVEPVRRAMQTIYAGLPYADVKPMRVSLERELRPWRLGATLFGAFGTIALVLSALGLYSVVAYSVAQRTHEMGVRVALGAQVADIVRLVLAQGLGVAAVGVGVGIALALVGARYAQPLLYETSARDPRILGGVAFILLAVATTASLIPARRATRADPLSALRAE